MVALCDQAGTVRAGEELDLARLRSISVRPLWSKRTGFRGTISQRPLQSDLPGAAREPGSRVAPPPFGSKVRTAHDMSRDIACCLNCILRSSRGAEGHPLL